MYEWSVQTTRGLRRGLRIFFFFLLLYFISNDCLCLFCLCFDSSHCKKVRSLGLRTFCVCTLASSHPSATCMWGQLQSECELKMVASFCYTTKFGPDFIQRQLGWQYLRVPVQEKRVWKRDEWTSVKGYTHVFSSAHRWVFESPNENKWRTIYTHCISQPW